MDNGSIGEYGFFDAQFIEGDSPNTNPNSAIQYMMDTMCSQRTKECFLAPFLKGYSKALRVFNSIHFKLSITSFQLNTF